MASQSCSIGKIEGSECHNKVHTHGKIGNSLTSELSKEDFDLLIWRTGIGKDNLKTICFHHQKLFLEKFTILNPFCCDPFRCHTGKKSIKGKHINNSTIQNITPFH